MAVEEPDTFTLTEIACYPNPYNPDTGSTMLMYRLGDEADSVEISIYTVGGRMIKKITGTSTSFGHNEEEWDGREENGGELGNGVYLFRVTAVKGAKENTGAGKIVIMK